MTIREAILAQSPNKQFETILRAILAKVDWTIQSGGALDQMIQAQADIEQWIKDYGGDINVGAKVSLPGDPPPLALFCLAMIDLDMSQMIAYDKRLAQPIWNNGKTISYNMGAAEAAGDVGAHQMCEVLAEVLGPDHCKHAYDGGNGD